MADIDYDKLQEAFEKALARGSPTTGGSDARSRRELNDRVRENIVKLRDLRDTLQQSGSKITMFNNLLTGQKVAIKDNRDEIEKLNKEIQRESSARARSVMESRRDALQEQQSRSLRTSAFFSTVDVFRTSLNSLTDNIFSTIGNFVRGLQGRGSSFSLASGLLTGAVTVANSAVQGLSGGLTAAGSALAGFAKAPWARALGLVLGGFGIALGSASDAVSKLAKFGIEILNAELEKTAESFKTASTVGAIFGGGLSELRNNAASAGLTIEQFSAVLRNSSDAIAQSGMGVSEGARMIGRVNQQLIRSGIQDRLLKLGYGFEEQAELIATVSADMRRLGGQVTDRQVAEQTQRYAENLRLIANLTGQDAKAKVAQVREQNNILAFQQKLAGLPVAMQQEITTAMATMTQMEQKALRERVIFNGVVRDRDAAIYESQFAGAREKGQAIYQLFLQNEMTAKGTARLNAQYNQQIRDSVLSQESLAQAAYVGNNALQGVAKGGVELLDQAARQTAKAVQESGEIDRAATTTDALTNSYVAAEKAAQSLRISLQDRLLPLMEEYSRVTAAILTTVDRMLKELPIGRGAAGAAAAEGTKPQQSLLEKGADLIPGIGGIDKSRSATEAITRGALGALGLLGGGALGLFLGKGIGGATLGAGLGGLGAEKLSDMLFGGLPGRAVGGEVDAGKLYKVGETGVEAFRPKVSGEIIPNAYLKNMSSNTGSNTSDILNKLVQLLSQQPLSGTTTKTDMLLTELKQIMQEQTSLTKQIIDTQVDTGDVMKDVRTLNQQMLNNNY